MEQASPQQRRPVLIAHRGAPLVSGHAENTQAAFEAALDAGFTHVETDLRVGPEGRLVLAHDPGDAKTGETLDACWPVLKRYGWINLELKESEAVPVLAAWIDTHVPEEDLRGRLVISSFHPGALLQMRQRLPWMRIAALYLPEMGDLNLLAEIPLDSINVTKEFAAGLAAKPAAFGGLPVLAFTVNEAAWLKRLPDWVTGVFTDSLCP